MGFSRKLQYQLVKLLAISNKEAQRLISCGSIKINGAAVCQNVVIGPHDEIMAGDRIIRPAPEFIYLMFNKPAGFQSSLHEDVPDNLAQFFTPYQNLAIAGRLDKASEGLLLLSNNGRWIKDITDPSSGKEKEYIVKLEQEPTAGFQALFAAGIPIGAYLTRPCICEKIAPFTVRIVLTEGKNRQIRRMCRKLGNEVVQLTRIRIHHYRLNGLQPGQYENFKP